jgi:GT2 family glycosyltransferase
MIRNPTNSGFARANNIGIQSAARERDIALLKRFHVAVIRMNDCVHPVVRRMALANDGCSESKKVGRSF